jgi:hypothetical protein
MAVTFDLSGSVLITEGNWRDHVQPLSGPDGPGYVPRDYDRHPVGSYKGGKKFPDALRYDEKQLREIFREQEANKTSLRHITGPVAAALASAIAHQLLLVLCGRRRGDAHSRLRQSAVRAVVAVFGRLPN